MRLAVHKKAAGAAGSVLVRHRQEVGHIRDPMFWYLSTDERITLGKCNETGRRKRSKP